MIEDLKSKSGHLENREHKIDKLDVFATTIPSFNLEGRQEIGSVVGSIGSIIAFTLVLSFAILKLIHVQTGKSPIIGESREFGRYASRNDTIDMNQQKLAFTARNLITGDILNDPSHVEWLVAIFETNNVIKQTIPTHICNQADYD